MRLDTCYSVVLEHTLFYTIGSHWATATLADEAKPTRCCSTSSLQYCPAMRSVMDTASALRNPDSTVQNRVSPHSFSIFQWKHLKLQEICDQKFLQKAPKELETKLFEASDSLQPEAEDKAAPLVSQLWSTGRWAMLTKTCCPTKKCDAFLMGP